MKILITSVGRRVELLQAFRKSATDLGVDLTIIGTDIAEDAPALQFCDETKIVYRATDERYIPQLLSFCKNEKIDCLIPTIDTDLLCLSERKKEFEKIGTKVLISRPEKVKICRDKNYTSDYFLSLGLNSPKAFNSVEKFQQYINSGEVSFPAFIKPKDGSSSINAFRVENSDDLKLYAEKIGDYVIQPFISGREFTVDIFCDYDGNPVYITPRERLAIRAGEVLKTRITQDDSILNEMLILVDDYKPCGQITVQLIKDEKSGKNYYIEINPRFGGGAPLSIKAGADSTSAVIKMLNGEQLSYVSKAAKNGAVYCRFDQSVCVDEGEND